MTSPSHPCNDHACHPLEVSKTDPVAPKPGQPQGIAHIYSRTPIPQGPLFIRGLLLPIQRKGHSDSGLSQPSPQQIVVHSGRTQMSLDLQLHPPS